MHLTTAKCLCSKLGNKCSLSVDEKETSQGVLCQVFTSPAGTAPSLVALWLLGPHPAPHAHFRPCRAQNCPIPLSTELKPLGAEVAEAAEAAEPRAQRSVPAFGPLSAAPPHGTRAGGRHSGGHHSGTDAVRL